MDYAEFVRRLRAEDESPSQIHPFQRQLLGQLQVDQPRTQFLTTELLAQRQIQYNNTLNNLTWAPSNQITHLTTPLGDQSMDDATENTESIPAPTPRKYKKSDFRPTSVLVISPQVLEPLTDKDRAKLADSEVPMHKHMNFLKTFDHVKKLFFNVVEDTTFVTLTQMKGRVPSQAATLSNQALAQLDKALTPITGPIYQHNKYVHGILASKAYYDVIDPVNMLTYRLRYSPESPTISVTFTGERNHPDTITIPDNLVQMIVTELKQNQFGQPRTLNNLYSRFCRNSSQGTHLQNAVTEYKTQYSAAVSRLSDYMTAEYMSTPNQNKINEALKKLTAFVDKDPQFNYLFTKIDSDGTTLTLYINIIRNKGTMVSYNNNETGDVHKWLSTRYVQATGEGIKLHDGTTFIMPESQITFQLRVQKSLALSAATTAISLPEANHGSGGHRGYWGGHQVHPHAPGSIDREPCFGDFAVPIAQALDDYDFLSALHMINIFCNTYNQHDSAGTYTALWEQAPLEPSTTEPTTEPTAEAATDAEPISDEIANTEEFDERTLRAEIIRSRVRAIRNEFEADIEAPPPF